MFRSGLALSATVQGVTRENSIPPVETAKVAKVYASF